MPGLNVPLLCEQADMYISCTLGRGLHLQVNFDGGNFHPSCLRDENVEMLEKHHTCSDNIKNIFILIFYIIYKYIYNIFIYKIQKI